MHPKDFDIILCGGGHVGMSLALALTSLQIRVGLIDDAVDKNYGNRMFALSCASQKFLADLKVWPALHAHTTPIEHLHLSHQGHFGAARLHADEFRQRALGYTVPALELHRALRQAVDNSDITLFTPARLDRFCIDTDGVEVVLFTAAGSQTLRSYWVIGADGVNSDVRKLAGIGMQRHAYTQRALVAALDLEQSHHFTAYERLVGDQAITLLPHTAWQSAVIWIGEHDAIQALATLNDTQFMEKVQQIFGYRLGRFLAATPRLTYPLVHTRAEAVHAARLLLVGNAAQTLHPVGAQGFNLALRQLSILRQLLAAAPRTTDGDFDPTILSDYAARQYQETERTLTFVEHLINFSSSSRRLPLIARQMLIHFLGASRTAQRYLLDR